MSQAAVEFVSIEPDAPGCQITNKGTHASLLIPYLKPGDVTWVNVTTTMTNLTRDNILEYHESAPYIKPMKILTWWLVLSGLILLIPFTPQVRRAAAKLVSRKSSKP